MLSGDVSYFTQLQAIVPRMAHRDMEILGLCCAAVKTVLELDAEGSASREAVQLIADLVKRRKCVCPPAVVSMLLSLQLSEAEASNVKAEGALLCLGTLAALHPSELLS